MKSFAWLLTMLLLPLAVVAQKNPGEAATIEKIELKGQPAAGGKVTAVIKVRIEPGYHLHSNKPSQPEFIATALALQSVSGAKTGTLAYPPGKSEKVSGLDKPLSIYDGEFEISVPIGLNASVKLPLAIPATLTYQACKGSVCYRPQKLKFDISVASAPQQAPK